MAQTKTIKELIEILDTLQKQTDDNKYFYTTINKYLSDPLKISPNLLKEFNNIIRSFNYKKEIKYQIAFEYRFINRNIDLIRKININKSQIIRNNRRNDI